MEIDKYRNRMPIFGTDGGTIVAVDYAGGGLLQISTEDHDNPGTLRTELIYPKDFAALYHHQPTFHSTPPMTSPQK